MKKSKYTFLSTSFILIAQCLLPTFSFAQAGSLDTTFSGDGKLTTYTGGVIDIGYSVAIQADGKIAVGGVSNNDFVVVRYNIDGTLDNTFGIGGIETTDIASSSYDVGYSIVIQPDGKILLAGESDFDIAIVRYNTDGTLDNTFGSGGKVTTDIDGMGEIGTSVAIQSDNKIVVVGQTYTFSGYDIAIIRYKYDGSLDTTFSHDGIETTDFGSSYEYGFSVAIQSDGKIVLSGRTGGDIALARYNIDGTFDDTFDTDGKLTTDIGGSEDAGYSVLVQPDQKILVVGGSYIGMAMVRYNSDGSLDNTFGTDGIATPNVGYGFSAALQGDGKIVVASWGNGDFSLSRYFSDGTLDYTFSLGGVVTTDFGGVYDYGFSVALQADGKIVVAGCQSYGPGVMDNIAVARYNGDNVADGITEINYNSILVAPNPFMNEININCLVSGSRTGEIILFDVSGNKILQQEIIDDETKINTENLLPGFYFLNYTDGIKSKSFKMIKY